MRPNQYKGKKYKPKKLLERKYTKLGLDTKRIGKYVFVNFDDRLMVYGGGSYSSNKGLLASQIANNKIITKKIFKKHGINVPEGKVFSEDKKELAKKYLCKFDKAVIKPVDGRKGKGVTLGVLPANFDKAWNYAIDNSKSKRIIVEEMFEGIYTRFLVVDGKCEAVLKVSEPNVVGNGKDSIETLIEKKNKIRSLNPHLKRGLIQVDEHRISILKEQGYKLKSIPKKGKYVRIDKKANCAAGSDSSDITNEVHPQFKKIAELATQVIPGLDVAGLDFLIKDPTQVPTSDNYVVIENNGQPVLAGHMFPFYGEPIKIVDIIADKDLRRVNALKTFEMANGNTKQCFTSGGIAGDKEFNKNNYEEKLNDGELIETEFARRGFKPLKVAAYNLYKISNQWIGFHQAISSNLSLISTKLVKNLYWRKNIFEQTEVKIKTSCIFKLDDREGAENYWRSLDNPLMKFETGKVVRVTNENEGNFKLTWEDALEKSKSLVGKGVLIEEQFCRGNKAKYLVVDNQCVAVCLYEPVKIVGNGQDSIFSLVHEDLTKICHTKEVKISESDALCVVNNTVFNLGYDRDYIPQFGQEIVFYYECEDYDIQDSYSIYEYTNPYLIEIAESASKILPGLDIISVDIYSDNHFGKNSIPNYVVEDINTSPNICNYQYPSYGKENDVAKNIVDYIMHRAYRDKLVREMMD
ncbi:MAG: ATP-grasp domain-containing protein [Firmicutes bacterium]|nr:ATP-grasp domain-containing protein [Bacillota bacterium]